MNGLWATDIFRVSVSAQRLWYHLAATADDNGIVENAREVRARLGADGDDVRELLETGLVILTEDKQVCVQYPAGERPHFVEKENGITYVQVQPFVAGYGFLNSAVPIEVALVW